MDPDWQRLVKDFEKAVMISHSLIGFMKAVGLRREDYVMAASSSDGCCWRAPVPLPDEWFVPNKGVVMKVMELLTDLTVKN